MRNEDQIPTEMEFFHCQIFSQKITIFSQYKSVLVLDLVL